MKKRHDAPDDTAALRRRAAEQLSARQKAQKAEAGHPGTEGEVARLVHELQVHQIELELQNEELQRSRHEVEEALEKYTDLFDFAPIAYVTLDSDGIVVEANLAGANLLGIDRSQLVKQPLGRFVAAASRPAFEAFFRKLVGSQVRQDCELTFQSNDHRMIEVRLEAIGFASGPAWRVALIDITERKRNEMDRLVLNKLDSTGILAGGIAHDFNNLLTIILLSLELASKRAHGTELAARLEEAYQAALTARGLTQQLLIFAEGGASSRAPVYLAELILESARPAVSGSRVQLKFSLAAELWPAEVDQGQFGQVIRNMVLNAREAMPLGGVVSVRAENVVLSSGENHSLPAGEYVRVSIADQGGGIPPEVRPRIFDPYFSTKQRGTQKGMGLGLAICHSVIQKHNGAISVEPGLGVGATFHILLPAARPRAVAPAAAAPHARVRPGKILVMDDEPGVRDLTALMLQSSGHEVETAEDGSRAIEIFQKAKQADCPFDLVLLDLAVNGGMGGQEAMTALLGLDPNVKAIVMSGYAENTVIMSPERFGFKASLPKPFDADTLRRVIGGVMG